MMGAFWDGEGQGLNLILGLILAFSLILSPELTLAFLLGLLLYICLGLGASNETPEVAKRNELKKAKKLNDMDAACSTMVSVEPATKEKEKEELVEEDMGILITDVRAISQYEFDHLEEIYQETGSNENNQTKEKRWSEKVSKDPDPGYPGTFS